MRVNNNSVRQGLLFCGYLLDLLHKCINCHVERSETSRRFLLAERYGNPPLRSGQNDTNNFLTFARGQFLSFVFSSLALLAIGVLIPRKWGNYSQKHCDLNICIYNTLIHSHIIVPITNHVFDLYQNIFIDGIGLDKIDTYNYLSFCWGR